MSSTMKTLSLFASGVAIYYTSKYIYNFFYSKPKCALPKLASEELLREELKRNYEFFNEEGMKLIRDSFRFKRKNLKNNLSSYDLDKVNLILSKYGFDLTARAEELDLNIFVDIANNI